VVFVRQQVLGHPGPPQGGAGDAVRPRATFTRYQYSWSRPNTAARAPNGTPKARRNSGPEAPAAHPAMYGKANDGRTVMLSPAAFSRTRRTRRPSLREVRDSFSRYPLANPSGNSSGMARQKRSRTAWKATGSATSSG
jgi:hypothetical protein